MLKIWAHHHLHKVVSVTFTPNIYHVMKSVDRRSRARDAAPGNKKVGKSMFVAFFVGAVIYGAITLVFLILSSAELQESGLSTPSSLASVLVTSLFWPVTLIVMSLVVLASQFARAARDSHVPALRLVHRSH